MEYAFSGVKTVMLQSAAEVRCYSNGKYEKGSLVEW